MGTSTATAGRYTIATSEYFDYNFYYHYGNFVFYLYSCNCYYIWHYDGERWDNAVLLGSSVHPTCGAAVDIRDRDIIFVGCSSLSRAVIGCSKLYFSGGQIVWSCLVFLTTTFFPNEFLG